MIKHKTIVRKDEEDFDEACNKFRKDHNIKFSMFNTPVKNDTIEFVMVFGYEE